MSVPKLAAESNPQPSSATSVPISKIQNPGIPDLAENATISPVAELQTVNFDLLAANDPIEADKLFRACKADGFFYLDLRRAGDRKVLDLADGAFDLAKALYALDEVEKLSYDVDKLGTMRLNGYKPVGRNIGGVGGNRDGFESYAISQDSILSIDTAFPHPPIVSSHRPLVHAFSAALQTIATTLLASLSTSLHLPPSSTLQSFHRATAPSPSILRLLHYHAQPPSQRGQPGTPHTDLGSLTILFSSQLGLQVLPAGPGASWHYVLPRTGCAVVNVGDALALMTNDLFHSGLHRVYPLPGRAMQDRFSIAYLQRAEDQTPLVAVTSPLVEKRTTPEGKKSEMEVLTSGEWLQRKFQALKGEKVDFELLTGRKESVAA